MNDANNKNIAYWDEWYKGHYCERNQISSDDWLDYFMPIISEVRGPAIDLGCGSGNDTLYLLNKGKSVIPCDASMTAIQNIRDNFPEIREALCFDMLEKFPIGNNMTDLVIADLSLHYFTREDTIKILKEIKRILVNRGHLLARVNSMDDVNHGAGEGLEVEPHLYMTSDGRYKRFFDYADIYDIFSVFEIKYLRDQVMTRYKLPKKAYILDLKNRK